MSLSMLGVICLVCTLRSMIQCFVAAAFGVVAECATLLHNKLRNKSLVCHQPNKALIVVQLFVDYHTDHC